MDDLLTLLINLESNTERLSTARRELNQAELEFLLIPAVDGRTFRSNDVSAYNNRKTKLYFGRSLTSAEIGCFLSHVKCLRAFVESDARYALVLEDDVRLSASAKYTLGKVLQMTGGEELPEWDAINFGNKGKSKYAGDSQPIGDCSNALLRTYLFPVNAHAILWSKAGAEEFLRECHEIYLPVDHAFRHMLTRRGACFSLATPVARQSSAESDIDAAGDRKSSEGVWYQIAVGLRRQAELTFARRFRKTDRARPNQIQKRIPENELQ